MKALRSYKAEDLRRAVRIEKRDLMTELIPLKHRVSDIYARLEQLDEAERLLEGME